MYNADGGWLQWLDVFVKARAGDTRLQAVLQRYTRMLEAKRDKERVKQMLRDELVRPPSLSPSLLLLLLADHTARPGSTSYARARAPPAPSSGPRSTTARCCASSPSPSS